LLSTQSGNPTKKEKHTVTGRRCCSWQRRPIVSGCLTLRPRRWLAAEPHARRLCSPPSPRCSHPLERASSASPSHRIWTSCSSATRPSAAFLRAFASPLVEWSICASVKCRASRRSCSAGRVALSTRPRSAPTGRNAPSASSRLATRPPTRRVYIRSTRPWRQRRLQHLLVRDAKTRASSATSSSPTHPLTLPLTLPPTLPPALRGALAATL
jgi:hypothetical protein